MNNHGIDIAQMDLTTVFTSRGNLKKSQWLPAFKASDCEVRITCRYLVIRISNILLYQHNHSALRHTLDIWVEKVARFPWLHYLIAPDLNANMF